MPRRSLLVAAPLLSWACASFTASTPPNESPPVPDASTPVDEAGSPDPTDSGGVIGSDAGFTLDCTGAALCDDFEHASPTLDEWYPETTSGLSNLSLDATLAHSGTHSALAMLPTNDGEKETRIGRTFSTNVPTKGTITAWVFTADVIGNRFDVIELSWNDKNYLDVTLTKAGLILHVDGASGKSGDSPTPGPQLPPKTWVELTLVYDLPNNQLELTTSLDGATIGQPNSVDFGWSTGNSLEVTFGIESTTSAPAFEMSFDDVKLVAH